MNKKTLLAKIKKLPYVVVAFRYDDPNDFYVVGTACDHITAGRLAFDEQDLRGGKYTCKFLDLNEDFASKWSRVCDELGAEKGTTKDMLSI